MLIDEPFHPITQEGFKRLVDLANKGDRGALLNLRDVLDERQDIWKRVGDLAAHAEAAMIQRVAGTDHLAAESLKRKLAEMKTELAGSTPSPLERLAVERVVACWLQAQYADTLIASSSESRLAPQGLLLKRQDQAQRRLTAAIRSLTDIRRLLPNSNTTTSAKFAIYPKSASGQARTTRSG